MNTKIYGFKSKYISLKKEKLFKLSIIKQYSIKEKYDIYECKLFNGTTDKFLLYLYKDDKGNIEEYTNGDVIDIIGKFDIPKYYGNDGEFNYIRYLNSKGIYGVFYGFSHKYVLNQKGSYVTNLSIKVRKYLDDAIGDKLTYDNKQLFKSLMYGDDILLSNEISDNFKDIGVAHLLSVSGGSLVIFIYIIQFALKSLKVNKYINLIILILFLTFFSIISQFSIPIVRASVFMVISIICITYKIKKNIPLMLTILFSTYLLLNPISIYDISLQFTFLAVLGIYLFLGKISKYLNRQLGKMVVKGKNIRGIEFRLNSIRKFNSKKRGNRLKLDKKYRVLFIIIAIKNFCISVISMTIAAQIYIMPLQIFYFNNINIFNILFNIFCILIDNCIKVIGFISLIFINIPYMSNLLFYSLNEVLSLFIYLTNFFSNFKFAIVQIRSLGKIDILFIYIIIILSSIYFIYKNSDDEKVKKLKYVIRKICFNIIVIYITCSFIYTAYLKNYITIYNVSDGDYIYIKYKSKNIVIDCGSQDDYLIKQIVKGSIKKENIKKIDALYITHFHKDHVNGVEELSKIVKIEKIIYSNVYIENIKTNDNYIQIRNIAKDKNINLIEVKKGDRIDIGDVSFNILSPEYPILKGDQPNSNSMCIQLTTRSKTILFAADNTEETEKTLIGGGMLNRNIDMLKVAHHGSRTSTSQEFLNYFNHIGKAYISCDMEKYKHPHIEVIERLKKKGIDIKKTYIDKMIRHKL